MHYAFLYDWEIPKDEQVSRSEKDLNERISTILGMFDTYSTTKKADPHAAQESLEQALHNCHALIKQYPSCGEAYLIRGSMYYEKKEWDTALDDLHKAYAQKVDGAEKKISRVYTTRGLARRKAQDLEGALEDYTEALRVNPSCINAYTQRGELYYNSKDAVLLQEAEKDFSMAIKLAPARASFYFARGVVRDVVGKIATARTDFTKALELDPENDSAAFVRGCMYLRQGIFVEAQKDFAYALKCCKSKQKKKMIQDVLRYAIAGVPMKMSRIKLMVADSEDD